MLSQILHQSRRVDPDRVLDFLPALFAGSASAPTLLCPMHRLRPYRGFALSCRSTGLLCPPCQCQRPTLWSASTVPRLLCCPVPAPYSRTSKPVGSESSVHLYGRDDIGPMLLLQQDIRKHIHSGFRPLQPLARGYSDPVPDFRVDFSAAVIGSVSPLGPASHVSSESEAPGWDIVTRLEVDQLSDLLPSPPPSPDPMTNICLSPGSATTLSRLRSNERLHASPGAQDGICQGTLCPSLSGCSITARAFCVPP